MEIMHGGYRKGAGRKPLFSAERKKNRNIYITDDLYNKIMSLEIDGCTGFSQRCQFLIKEALLKYSTESSDKSGQA